jgi:uncharacterized OB-fold protein
MLHVVDGAVETGSRVKAKWRDETSGYITDIECFVPAPAERSGAGE